MKAKDLMIGDWVNYHDDGKIVPKQVSEITNFKQLQLTDKDNWIIVGERYCDPIPLTAEILEKNGFKTEHGFYCDVFSLEESERGSRIVFFPKDGNYTKGGYNYIHAEIGTEYGCTSIDELPIKYVHELQHALRLCSIEKEIIL